MIDTTKPLTTEEKVHLAAPPAVVARLIKETAESNARAGRPAEELSTVYQDILRRAGADQ